MATPAPQRKFLKLEYVQGDIFDAPDGTLLIQACNSQGRWGAGIATVFRQQYPRAHKGYQFHCKTTHDPIADPVPTGTHLFMPPEEKEGAPKHFIGCLFTSQKVGKAKDPPQQILRNTDRAMRSLLAQLKREKWVAVPGKSRMEDEDVKAVRMCKINSGNFGVKWEDTAAVLEAIEVHDGDIEQIEVWSLDG